VLSSKNVTSGFVPKLKIWSLHFNGRRLHVVKCLTIGSLYALLWISQMIGDMDRVLALPCECVMHSARGCAAEDKRSSLCKIFIPGRLFIVAIGIRL